MASSGERIVMIVDGQTVEVGCVGKIRLSLSSSFGGGTAKLQARDPSGAYVDVAGAAFTVAADQTFDFPDFCQNQVRIDLTGSTTPALVVWIQSSLSR